MLLALTSTPIGDCGLVRKLDSGGSLKDMLAGAPAADADHEAAPAPAPQEPGDLEC